MPNECLLSLIYLVAFPTGHNYTWHSCICFSWNSYKATDYNYILQAALGDRTIEGYICNINRLSKCITNITIITKVEMAREAFVSLENSWKSTKPTSSTKHKICNSNAKPVLLYEAYH